MKSAKRKMGREESSGRSPIKLKNSLNKFRVISEGNGRYIMDMQIVSNRIYRKKMCQNRQISNFY